MEHDVRFQFKTLVRAKELAQHLHQFLCAAKLSEMQQLSAQLYGYSDWHELSASTRDGANPSAWDHVCSAAQAKERFDFQYRVLANFLGQEYQAAASTLLCAVTPTAKHGAMIYPRHNLASGKGKPSVALAQSSVFFNQVDALRGNYDNFGAREEPEMVAGVKGIPEDAGLALSAQRNWGNSVVQMDGRYVVQSAAFRQIEAVDNHFVSAATWRFDLRACIDQESDLRARCVVEGLWAVDGAVPSMNQVGSLAAQLWWRIYLANWTSGEAELLKRRDAELESLSNEEHYAAVMRDLSSGNLSMLVGYRHIPQNIDFQLPNTPLGLPAAVLLPSRYSYTRGQRAGGGSGAAMNIQVGPYRFEGQRHTGGKLQLHVRHDEMHKLNCSRLMIDGDPQLPCLVWQLNALSK